MELTESQEVQLRSAFRCLNRNMILMWRLGLGRQVANPTTGYIMVLATTGRKSGERRLVPLNFAEQHGAVHCLAGFGRATHWLLNLEADPQCELWLPDGRRSSGRAELVSDESRRVDIIRQVLIRSGFAAKMAHPELELSTATDEAVAALGPRPGVRYEAVEIELGHPITGPRGPGDLTWVWPATVVVGLAAWWAARRCIKR